MLHADGATAPPIDADPLGEHRPSRIPARLLAGALAALLVLAGSAHGTRAITTADPTAFAVFARQSSAADVQARADLENVGAPMVGDARVLASDGAATVIAVRAPRGTGDALRRTGGRPLPTGPTISAPGASPAPVTATAEVCLYVLVPSSIPVGRCASVEDFLDRGVATASVSDSLEIVAHWTADGETAVQRFASGPTSIDDLQALGIPALERLAAMPRDSVAELDAASSLAGYGLGEAIIAPRTVSVRDEGRLTAGVYRPQDGGGFVVCLALRTGELPDAAPSGCTSIPEFLTSGARNGYGIDDRTTLWTWFPDGRVEITIEADDGAAR